MLETLTTISSSLFKGDSLVRSIPATFLTTTITAINLGAPYLLISALPRIDNDGQNPQNEMIYTLVGAYSAAWMLGKTLPPFREMFLSRLRPELAFSLTKKVVEQYYKLPMEYRTDHTAGAEVQHFSNSYEHIGDSFINTFYHELVPSIVEMLAIGGVLTYFYPVIGACVGGIVILYTISAIIGSSYVGESQIKRNEAAFKAFEGLLHRLENYESAHYYDNVVFELTQLDNALRPFNNASNKTNITQALSMVTQNFIMGLGYAGTIMLAIYHVLTLKKYNGNDLVWIILYLTQFVADLEIFSKSLNKIQQSHGNFKELLEYLNQDHAFKDDNLKSSLNVTKKSATVEFDNVTLVYKDKNDNALSNISFKVNVGETIALVGKSGAGKSSILNLLCGFYNPTSGQVYISNQDLSSVNRASIRKALAIIPQSPYLINDTIFNNVKYGDLDATDPQIYEAIAKARLNKLNVNGDIGENGKKLSGGQKQRIAIARAILRIIRGASILIADEPTSALDEKTSSKILTQIFGLVRTYMVTFFMVTHNLKTIVNPENVNNVIVVEDGKIVTSGTVAQLLSQQGIFSLKTSLLEALGETPIGRPTGNNKIKVKDADTNSESQEDESRPLNQNKGFGYGATHAIN